MQEQVREKEHALNLKVMRLSKPTIKPVLNILSESFDLAGNIFKDEILSNVAATKGAEHLSTGEILSLPQSFGSIYLGETFSCYVSILNESNMICREVSSKTDIQTSSQRFPLTINKPKDQLGPDESIDEVLNYEVKELGTHILICGVTYVNVREEKQFMRRFYKFQVLKPLEVKTKFYNAKDDIVFLEAQVQNITTAPMCMTDVLLEPSQYYDMFSLNKVFENEAENSYESSYMNPMDVRQYLYKLVPKPEHIRELKSKPLSAIGKLDITWRTNFGEKGRLQTSQLQRTAPPEEDVTLNTIEAPDVVKLESQIKIVCRLENSGLSKMEVKLILNNPIHEAFLWCGISGKVLGPLPPNAYLDIELHLLPIKSGLFPVDGIQITDLNSGKDHNFNDVVKILVYASDESPFS